jgi:hypothetical protein
MQNIDEVFKYRPKLNIVERNKYYLLKKFPVTETYDSCLPINDNIITDYQNIETNKSFATRNNLSKSSEKEKIIINLKKKLNDDRNKLITNRRIREEEEIKLFTKINESQALIEKEIFEKKIIEKHEKYFKLKKLNIQEYKQKQKTKNVEMEKNMEDKSPNEKTEQKYNFEDKLREIEENSYLVYNVFYSSKDLQKRIKYFLLIDEFINEEINFDNEKNEKNLMTPKEAISSDNYINRFLGFFGAELLKYKIKNVYIEKNPSNEIVRDVTFKIIIKEITNQKVYKLTVISPSMKRNIFRNIKNWYNFNEMIKQKLVKKFNISEYDIFFYNYNIKNFEVNMLIYNRKIENIEYVLKEMKVKATICNVLTNIILSSNMFETKFCKNINEWTKKDGNRGGKTYYHPIGWIGLALKIKDKYGKSNAWIGKEGLKGEWAVAYHGVGKGNEFEKVLNILNKGLRPGPNQFYSYHLNNNSLCRDLYCGKGVYLAPEIDVAEKYANKLKLGEYKKNIQFIIMARVNPYRTREPDIYPTNWVLNGNTDEIRQYRLLVKYVDD